jgi:high-affinity iron transporter
LAISVAGSAALGIGLARLGSMSPLWEGWLALAAAGAVVGCVAHMRRMGKAMGAQISGGLGKAALLDGSKAWWAVFGFTCFMVGREGVETAAMLASLAGNNEQSRMVPGALGGVLSASVVALAWVKFGRKVDLSRFFNVTSIFMLVFAAALVLRAFFEFTEMGALPWIDNAYWHELSEPLVEGFRAQLVSVLLVLAPTLWLVVAQLLDRKKSVEAFQP